MSKVGKKVVTAVACICIVIFTLIAIVVCGVKIITSEETPIARRNFVSTILETGQLKFLATWFVDSDVIKEVVKSNSMAKLDIEVDKSLLSFTVESKVATVEGSVTANKDSEEQVVIEEEDIKIEAVGGPTFSGTMMIVKDPSRVSIATIYPWAHKGVTLEKLVVDNSAVAGINGGLYYSDNNSGGTPAGVVVSNGEILRNKPQEEPGLVLIAMTEDNVLLIENVGNRNAEDIEAWVSAMHIRDCIVFQEEDSDKNNHFVQLIINGKERRMVGMGSGLNPRTAIGQRSDGALLLLVTDGRGKNGHLGASASDLISVMTEYGAVNAANLDGGSSSCMYYEDKYLQDSVTFYYNNSSWNLPLAWIIK